MAKRVTTKTRTKPRTNIAPVRNSKPERRINISAAEGGYILNVCEESRAGYKEKKVIASSQADLVKKLKSHLG